MLKLPHISKPISQFGWIISDSNNQNEILFLIVYTKKTRYVLFRTLNDASFFTLNCAVSV